LCIISLDVSLQKQFLGEIGMSCKCEKLVNFIESELLLIEELLENVSYGKRTHLRLDSKKDAYKKVLNIFRG
jgi:hypothetical protein